MNAAATKVTKSQAKFFNCNFVSHAAACVGYSLMRGRQRTFCEKKLTKCHLRILKLVKVELSLAQLFFCSIFNTTCSNYSYIFFLNYLKHLIIFQKQLVQLQTITFEYVVNIPRMYVHCTYNTSSHSIWHSH